MMVWDAPSARKVDASPSRPLFPLGGLMEQSNASHQTHLTASPAPLNLKMDMEPPTTDDDDQWVYDWEEELFD
jgi:hypothetical protein